MQCQECQEMRVESANVVANWRRLINEMNANGFKHALAHHLLTDLNIFPNVRLHMLPLIIQSNNNISRLDNFLVRSRAR